MANVVVNLVANDAAEQISAYHYFMDDAEVGGDPGVQFTVQNVTPGVHKFEVAAEGPWGVGPKSDPVSTPPMASKCQGVTINIVINIA